MCIRKEEEKKKEKKRKKKDHKQVEGAQRHENSRASNQKSALNGMCKLKHWTNKHDSKYL